MDHLNFYQNSLLSGEKGWRFGTYGNRISTRTPSFAPSAASSTASTTTRTRTRTRIAGGRRSSSAELGGHGELREEERKEKMQALKKIEVTGGCLYSHKKMI